MQRARLNGAELEFEVRGAGEPLLLIGTGPFRDSFRPLVAEPAVVASCRTIRYRQRGQVQDHQTGRPVPFSEHAADAAQLLRHLEVPAAHVVGHSTGAAIALQLALDHPERVRSLILLETPLMSGPNAQGFMEAIGPALAAYGEGASDRAMELFLSVVSGLDWPACEAVVERSLPGGIQRAKEDAHVFFGSYLPALEQWSFGRSEAERLTLPVLAVLGSHTHALFRDGHTFMLRWLPEVDECVIPEVGHLLSMQDPGEVAHCTADFVRRHSVSGRQVAGAAHEAVRRAT
jgi:pimeloyl-ACP methyl ester carboxylesterase